MMNVRNPWVKRVIANVHVFHKGKLMLWVITPAKKIVISANNIEVHYTKTVNSPRLNLANVIDPLDMNIIITDQNGTLLETWTLQSVNWGGGSYNSNSGFYCFSSNYVSMIKSQYMG